MSLFCVLLWLFLWGFICTLILCLFHFWYEQCHQYTHEKSDEVAQNFCPHNFFCKALVDLFKKLVYVKCRRNFILHWNWYLHNEHLPLTTNKVTQQTYNTYPYCIFLHISWTIFCAVNKYTNADAYKVTIAYPYCLYLQKNSALQYCPHSTLYFSGGLQNG